MPKIGERLSYWSAPPDSDPAGSPRTSCADLPEVVLMIAVSPVLQNPDANRCYRTRAGVLSPQIIYRHDGAVSLNYGQEDLIHSLIVVFCIGQFDTAQVEFADLFDG